MILNLGEHVYVTTTGIGTKETFIGISYDEGKVTQKGMVEEWNLQCLLSL